MENQVIQHLPKLEENSRVTVGEDMRFDRVRRITGYLVGTLDRFNNAKRAEVHDRVKHMGKM